MDALELPAADREHNRMIAEEQNALQAVADHANDKAGRSPNRLATDADVVIDDNGHPTDPTHFRARFVVNRQRIFTSTSATLLDIVNKLRANPGQVQIEKLCVRLEHLREDLDGAAKPDASLANVRASRSGALASGVITRNNGTPAESEAFTMPDETDAERKAREKREAKEFRDAVK